MKRDKPLPGTATCRLTCAAFPEQYEGTLEDGRFFYFRMRHGGASLGVGVDLDSAVEDSWSNGIDVYEGNEGSFTTTKKRDRTFLKLLENRREL